MAKWDRRTKKNEENLFIFVLKWTWVAEAISKSKVENIHAIKSEMCRFSSNFFIHRHLLRIEKWNYIVAFLFFAPISTSFIFFSLVLCAFSVVVLGEAIGTKKRIVVCGFLFYFSFAFLFLEHLLATMFRISHNIVSLTLIGKPINRWTISCSFVQRMRSSFSFYVKMRTFCRSLSFAGVRYRHSSRFEAERVQCHLFIESDDWLKERSRQNTKNLRTKEHQKCN